MSLKIYVPGVELWDEKNEEFIETKDTTLVLEHSLVSISKWEAKWHIPFLTDNEKFKKTEEQEMDYIKFMVITQNVNENVFNALTYKNRKQIEEYIANKMTATWFNNDILFEKLNKGDKKRKRRRKEELTSELIYYMMFSYGIPIECEKWHINRLLTLIRVFQAKNEENDPKNKRKPIDVQREYSKINSMRRKQMGTKG